jgi:hypothetical protein
MDNKQGFEAVFGVTRGNADILTRNDLQILGPQHKEVREIIEQLEYLADQDMICPPMSEEEKTYNASASYKAGLFTGPYAANSFYDVYKGISKVAQEYLGSKEQSEYVNRAFSNALIASQLKEILPENLYIALMMSWWKLFDNERADEAPSIADIQLLNP